MLETCRRRRLRLITALSVLPASGLARGGSAARADTFTWTAGDVTNGFVDLGTNWQASGGAALAPPGDGSADLVFGPVAKAYVPTNRYGQSVRSITFAANASAGSAGYTLAAANGVGLTLGGGGIADNAALVQTVAEPLLLSAGQAWNVAAGGTLAITGPVNTNGYGLTVTGGGTTTVAAAVSGAGGVAVSGGGQLALAGSNTYTGGTTLAGGTLSLGGGGAIPATGAVTFAGGTLRYTSANTTDYSARFTSTGGAAVSIDTNGQSVALATPLAGSGGLAKLGAGTLTLSAVGTYAGPTNVSGGTLSVPAGGGLGTAAVGINVDGPAAAAATLSVAGGANGSGTTVAAQYIEVGLAGAGTLVQTGGSVSAVYGIDVGYGNTGTGTYLLSGGQLALGTGQLDVGTLGTGLLNQSGGSVTCGEIDLGYTGAASGTLNLSGGTIAATSRVYVGASGGCTGVVRQTGGLLSAPVVILAYGNTATGTYTLAGGTVATTSVYEATLSRTGRDLHGNGTFRFDGGTLQASADAPNLMTNLVLADVAAGGARVDTNGHAATIAQPLQHAATPGGAADGGLTKVGAGTLTLTGANGYTGPTTVAAGTLVLAGSGTVAGGLRAAAGAEIDYAASAGVTVLGSLSGPGLQRVTTGTATFAGGTMYNGVNLVVLAPTTLAQVASAANVNVGSGTVLTWQDGSNALGTLTVNGTANVSGWTSTGVVVVAAGGAMTNVAGSNLLLGGGSRTTVAAGGTLTAAAGTTVELNGGLLVNNGTVAGTVDVNFGSLATGTGTYAVPVVVNAGGTFAPGAYGTASPAANTASTLALVQPAAAGVTTAAPAVVVTADAVVTVNGSDALTLAGSLRAGGHAVTKVGTGTLVVAPFAATTLSVGAGTLRLTPSGVPLAVAGLSVAAGATLDLGVDAVDVVGGDSASLSALVAGGRIASSAAAADPLRVTAVGVAPGPAGDVLARFTYVGDADLDGVVDGQDYGRLDAGYASQSTATRLTGWYNGDFNYDGSVDGSDYTLIDNAFNLQRRTAVATATAELAAVPEPAGVAAWGGLTALAAGRRRRRTRRVAGPGNFAAALTAAAAW